MSRLPLIVAFAAASTAAATAQARPIFMQYEGVDGSCSASTNQVETFVGGQRAVIWQVPSGSGEIVFRPSPQNADRPMESLSLNFTKVTFTTIPMGASVRIADDVIVDGRIITGGLWARWRKGEGEAVHLDFGKSREIDGQVVVQLKRNGVPVAQNTCTGDIVACWVLTALCPELECSIMCPALCGVPAVGRTDPAGGVAIDLPLGGDTTFALPGGGAATGDEVSVILRPFQPTFLGGVSVAVGDINGLQFNSVRGDFACPADFNASGEVSVQDIFDFLAAFFAADPAADFNASASLSVQDLFDFLAAYFRGCP
jgi:hypothetical protein